MEVIFLSDLNLKDVNPKECGEEFCEKNLRIGPTSRQYYLLHYIFTGSGVFSVNNINHNLTKGHIFIIHPFEIVRYKSSSTDPWHYCWIGFELSFESPGLSKNSTIYLPQSEHIFNSFKNSKMIESQKELYICGKIYELLSMIGDYESSFGNKSAQYANKAKQYMDINYIYPITVEQVAKDLNISRSYFSAVFKKHFGKSPQQYLINKRLENAAELISNYGYSVTDAASSSGYSDIFNFSKIFKQKFGFPPTHYLKNKNNIL